MNQSDHVTKLYIGLFMYNFINFYKTCFWKFEKLLQEFGQLVWLIHGVKWNNTKLMRYKNFGYLNFSYIIQNVFWNSIV